MFANTGYFSFYLFGIILIATVACLVWVIRSGMEQTRLDKVIELLKYSIVSIFITTASIIITNLFKEREQEVKELEYFDKYVNDVKKADGIEERLRLSKYLSIVAPGGELKKSWTAYYESVQEDYKAYQNSKALIAKDTLKTLNPKEEAKLEKAIALVQNESKPLTSVSNASGKIYFQVTNASLKDFSNSLVAQLQKINYKALGTEYVGVALKNNEIRYFNEADLVNANQLQADLKKYGLNAAVKKIILNGAVPNGQLEVWITTKN